MIIQSSNNNLTEWSSVANFSFAMTILLFIKDATLLTLYMIRRFIDGASAPELRPKATGQIFRKVSRENALNIRNYLMDPNDGAVDEEGNTTMHQLTKFEDVNDLQNQISSNPHMLFMLNKQGMTPLDIAINEKEEEKAKIFIDRMQKYNNNCSLKFVKRPNRLDLRYEKSFTLAILRNNLALITSFPEKTVKTVTVCMT